jgi:predicted phosphate transport protein (TIGR00153 family)
MLSWFRAVMPQEDRFFDLFEQHAAILIAGAEALQGMLRGGEDVQSYCRTISAREEDADQITRDVLLAVQRSFITPFDRSHITGLIQSMDDSIDQMKQTVKTVTLFERTEFEPQMREMGDTILEAARLTAKAMPLLRKVGKNVEALRTFAEELAIIEERADDLHDEGLKALYRRHGDASPMAYIIGADIYGHLERVVDRLEDVSTEISGIVVESV